MSIQDSLYRAMPPRLQSAAANLYGAKLRRERFGKRFDEICRELDKSEGLDATALRKMQEERLSVVINHAKQHVPFYRHLFENNVIDDRAFWTFDDLASFPVIDKETVRSSESLFLSEKFRPNDRVHGHTSGTTGSPLSLHYSRDNVVHTAAVDWRQKQWAGVSRADVGAVLLGRTIVSPSRNRPPFGIMIRPLRQLWLSAFHLSPTFSSWYVEAIRSHGAKYIEGYPSTLFELAKLLSADGHGFRMKAAFTSSEPLYEYQRELIEEVFGCEVFDFYGLAERVAFAMECPENHRKHLCHDYGVTEVVDESGVRLVNDKVGFLAGTSLTNLAMPLIRYRTSDEVAILSDACACGRAASTISSVVTKCEDVIRLKNGRAISPSALTHPFKPHDCIEKSQIEQLSRDLLIVRLVMSAQANARVVEEELRRDLHERLGADIQVQFEHVTDIPRGANGKYRWVISRVRD